MASDSQRDDRADYNELVHTVRDLRARVERLERSAQIAADEPAAEPGHTLTSVPRNGALESRIGSQWLNRIGVVAVLFGVAYLLRYAFARQWISAAAWIWLGVCAGVVVTLTSEAFRCRGYRVLSLSLKATGVGVTYLSLWAGLELYQVLSAPQTFAALVILTILAAALAFREHAQVLAALALIGAFATPLLILIPSREGTLFLYITILDLATAVAALSRGWWRLLAFSFVGTALLCAVWYFERYTRVELALTVVAATVFFAIFCVATALRRPLADKDGRLLTALATANAAVYFGGLYLLLIDANRDALATAALILAILYFVLARSAMHSATAAGATIAIYGGLGIAFIAVALAIWLPLEWLSLGWFLEAAVVMAVGFWRDLRWLRWGALVLLCAAVVKAFAYDVWQLGLGYRTISFIALGVLLLGISFAYQRYGFSVVGKIDKGPADRPR